MTEGQQAQSKTQKVSDVICTYRPTKVSAEKKEKSYLSSQASDLTVFSTLVVSTIEAR